MRGPSVSLYFFRLTILRNDYVYRLHALFIYLIPEDVRPGNSTPIGIIGALGTVPIASYTHPGKKTTMDKIGTGNENYEFS